MRVLVACEFSGIVRDAFKAMGHHAFSCDLLPTEAPGLHYQCDVLRILDRKWDLMIAFPPCTYLCSSGLSWNAYDKTRAAKTEDALVFVQALLDADIPRIALENPVGCIGTRICKATQIIQPYQYGHDAAKRTCLWLKGLPKLRPTERIPPRVVDGGYKRWANQRDDGQNVLGESKDRWRERSRTYTGIARAMAEQWGNL